MPGVNMAALHSEKWLRLYRKAILERRAECSFTRAQQAWIAVESRVLELKRSRLICIEEWQGLQQAAHTLEILLGSC